MYTDTTPAVIPSESDVSDGSKLESQKEEQTPTPDAEIEQKEEEQYLETNCDKEGELDVTRTKSNFSIAETLSPWREFAFVAIVCMAQVMTQAGLSQCLVTLHVIGDSFKITEPGELSWLIAGYSLTVGTFILIAGRLGDVFGHKKMLVIGFLWFSLWSLIAGVSHYANAVVFIFSRVLVGIGAAICMTNGLALIGMAYGPGPRKNMVFAIFGACAPIGGVLGGAVAALFALVSWPWVFYSFAIALLSLALLAMAIIPDPRPHTKQYKSIRELVKQLDLLGGVVGVLSLILINFAWNQAPTSGWGKPEVIITLILGLLCIPAFFYIELHFCTTPLIPFKAFSTDVTFVLICVACGWSCFGIWFYYTFQFWQLLRHASPLLSIAYLSPVAVSGALASVTTGFLLSRVRPPWVMAASLAAFTVGSVIIATMPVDQSYWAQSFVGIIIIPWGMDMSFPAATVILSNSVSKKHQGIAASLVSTIVNYSISLGLGFAGTVEVHVNNGGTNPQDLLAGFRGAWYMGIGLASLGLATSFLYLWKCYRKGREHCFPE